MSRRYAMVLLAVATLTPAMPAIADGDPRSLRAGEFTVHYNAVPSTALGADMARRYELTRSGTRGLLNVAVLRQADDAGEAHAVPARITAQARSLLGQVQTIELRELRDQDAIYYIGQFRIRGEERLRFDLVVRPEGGAHDIAVRFEHAFDGR